MQKNCAKKLVGEIRNLIGPQLYDEMKKEKKKWKKEKAKSEEFAYELIKTPDENETINNLSLYQMEKVETKNERKENNNEQKEKNTKGERNWSIKRENGKKRKKRKKKKRNKFEGKERLHEEKEELHEETSKQHTANKMKYIKEIENMKCTTNGKEINKQRKQKKQKQEEQLDIEEKQEICKYYFLKGKCKNGKSCIFSHDIDPLYKFSKLCKFQLKDECNRKDCPFSHDISLFYCRNDIIGKCCSNPVCKFKHINIDRKGKSPQQINEEINKVLSKNDKIRFVFNNKSFIMDMFIRNFLKINSEKKINLEEIKKNDNYPWYINDLIDLLKIDSKYNKLQPFYRLVENVLNAKTFGLLKYIEDEKLKEQVQIQLQTQTQTQTQTQLQIQTQKQPQVHTSNWFPPKDSTSKYIPLKYSDSDTTAPTVYPLSVTSTVSVNIAHDKTSANTNNNFNDHSDKQKYDSNNIKEETEDANATEQHFYEHKFYSSEDEAEYSKYLSSYLKVPT